METNYLENNYLVLVGKVASEKSFSHEIYGESFYTLNLEIPRLSQTADIIPVTVSERLITNMNLTIGQDVKVEGQFRSYNSYDSRKSRLILTVFAKDIEALEPQEVSGTFPVSNEVVLVGVVCRVPVYRKTPFGREIADLLLAVHRAYGKSDYIPCITWGRNARFCQDMTVGTEVRAVGRVQSRIYEKKHEDGTVEEKTAYEVSISSLELVNKESTDNEVSEESSSNQEAI